MTALPQRLTCSTAAKRKALASVILDVAAAHGADAEIVDWSEISPRELSVKISLGDYRCSVDFDGSSAVPGFLAHWHAGAFTGAKYPRDFGHVCRGSVNTFHFGKATTCVDTFDELRVTLDRSLDRLSREVAP